MGPLLVVTAVAAERDAVLAGIRGPDRPPGAGAAAADPGGAGDPAGSGGGPGGGAADRQPGRMAVAAVGVGPAAAAAGTARLLALAEAAGRAYRDVVCAGIAGGFAGRAAVGGVVLGTRSTQADLGADSPEGFLNLDRLGFGTATVATDPELLLRLAAALPEAATGEVLTVATVTGTAERAAALAAAHPDAVAEAMEGYGAGCAAASAGAGFAELRTISNLVGPRDRAAWRIPRALAALTDAAAALWRGWSADVTVSR